MPKFHPQKTSPRRRRSAVGILLSGLERIAADLRSYATLPDEPLKPWLKSDSVAPPASEVHIDCSFILLEMIFSQCIQKIGYRAKDHGYRLPVAKRLRLSPSLSSSAPPKSQACIAEPPFLPTIQDVETAPSTSLSPVTVERCIAHPLNQLLKRSIIDLLPNEMFDLVGQWLDDEDLKVATMVCELFRDIFFPKYLRRNKFSPRQSFISLQGLSNFRVFRSYHRFPHRPWRPYLSAYFGRDADADRELSCLAYALAQFPAGAFRSISLCFSSYNLIHAEPLTELLTALVPIQCANLTITGRLTGEHHIDILMPPVYTAWNLTSLTIEGNLNYTPFRPLLLGVSQLLEDLTLRSLEATTTSFLWKTLLNTTTFPKLRSFQTSEDMPLPLLLEFLSRHPKVAILAITINTYSKIMPNDGVIEKIDLKFLKIISGPPSYILTVLRSASAAPSLARLSLILNHLPNMSIFPEVLKCLAVCQKVDALEITLRPNCRVSTQTDDIPPLLDITTLAIKVFRIIFLDPDFGQDGHASNEDIMATWDEWQNYFHTIRHFQLEECISLGLRNSFFEESCKRFPTLAVSVCLGWELMANKLALETGGFDWHTI